MLFIHVLFSVLDIHIKLHGYSLYQDKIFVQWTVSVVKYYEQLIDNAHFQLTEQLCYPLVQYLITHNVSSDQSTITVNRTNVTLYGVQPGETYTVEIIPCRTHHCLLLVSNVLLIEGIIHCQQLTVNE